MLDARIPPLDQSISTLTVADLRALVVNVVRQVLREEMGAAPPLPSRGELPEPFLDTFGSWQEERSAEEIARDILESRTVSTVEVTL